LFNIQTFLKNRGVLGTVATVVLCQRFARIFASLLVNAAKMTMAGIRDVAHSMRRESWMVGKDVAAALGYSDTFGALKKHVYDEDKQNCQNDSFETPRGMTIINESGLYSLILSSKLPSAKEFKCWVTHEVLLSIRKPGNKNIVTFHDITSVIVSNVGTVRPDSVTT